MPDPIYKTKDGQKVTKGQLISSGYSEDRINKGIGNGILTLIGDTDTPTQSYKTKEGQTVTTEQLLGSGYSQDRINKGVYNGILIPEETVKKKGTFLQGVGKAIQGSGLGSLVGGMAGNGLSNGKVSEKGVSNKNAQDYIESQSSLLKKLKTSSQKQPVLSDDERKQVSDYAYSLKTPEEKQLAQPLSPQEEAYNVGRKALSEILTSPEREDPISAAEKRVSNSTGVQDAIKNYMAKKFLDDSISGFDAKQLLQTSDYGKGDANNKTTQLLKNKATEYDKIAEPLRAFGDFEPTIKAFNQDIPVNYKENLYDLAIRAYMDAHPIFKGQAKAANVIPEDGFKFNTQTTSIPKEMIGKMMDWYLNQPAIHDYITKENPKSLGVFQQIQNDLLKDNPDYGINQVANEVSQAIVNKGYYNTVGGHIGYVWNQTAKDYADNTAKELYADNPDKLEIWNKYVKDNQEKYLDEPGFLPQAATRIKSVFKGFKNTFQTIADAAQTSIIEEWNKEAKNVSANPKGFLKFVTDTGDVVGLVSSLAATGNVLGGTTAANMLTTGVAFFGDELDAARLKYPDNPVKAITSATLMTGLYMALSKDIFPAQKVNQALKDVKPGVAKVVENLADGKISQEVARQETNNIWKKVLNVAGQGLVQNTKITLELSGITTANRIFDKLNMSDEQFKEAHPDSEIPQSITHTFLSNLLVAGVAGYGKVRGKEKEAINSIYEAASNPDFYKKYLTNTDALANLDFISKRKKELDAQGVSENEQKNILQSELNDHVKEKLSTPTYSPKGEETRISEQHLSEEQNLIKKALDDGTLIGYNVDMAKAALKDPEAATQFMDMVRQQAYNQVAPDATTQENTLAKAKKDFGEDLVNAANPQSGIKPDQTSDIIPEKVQEPEGNDIGGELGDKQHSENIKNKFREQFKAKGVSDEQISGAVALMDARAKSWASEEKGRNADEWYSRIADVRSGEFVDGSGRQFQVEAYHGSPHDFDKFSISKIGTGEGAAAFGHGLYFTDLKGIAEGYAEKLSETKIKIDGQDLLDFIDAAGIRTKNKGWLQDVVGDASTKGAAIRNIDGIIKFKESKIADFEEIINDPESTRNERAIAQGGLNSAEIDLQNLYDLHNAIFRAKDYQFLDGKRNLYKVTIHEGKTPEQYDWLEWDKDLPKEKIDKIRKALFEYELPDGYSWATDVNKNKNHVVHQIKDRDGNIVGEGIDKQTAAKNAGIGQRFHPYFGEERRNIEFDKVFKRNSDGKYTTGAGFYHRLSELLGSDKAASDLLLKAGIDGVKYPAESIARGTTSDNARGFNYVVFDDKAVSIKEKIQFQNNKGAVETLSDGRKVIHALDAPDFSTMVHEIAHVFEGDLTAAEQKIVKDFGGSEPFARGFEKYLRDGKAPTTELKSIFEKFKEWLTNIYKSLKGSPIEKRLSPEIRKIFDRLLTENKPLTEGAKDIPSEDWSRDVESTAKALEDLNVQDLDKLTPKQKAELYKKHGIKNTDGSEITEKDIEADPLQYSYDFMASSNSGKWNSANSELESAVQGNKKQSSLYKLMLGEFDTFKEFVDFINSKNYGDKIEYTERMKRADDMSPEERKSAIDSYNKSVEDKADDKAQKQKDILNEHGFEDEKEYSPQEIINKFPLKGVQKIIYDIIKNVADKLGIKVKFSSSRITEGFEGSNNPLNGEILISPQTLKNGRIGEVLVHEVVHALTTKIISRVNSGVETGLSKTQIAAVKGLNKLYEAVRRDTKLENKYPVKDIFEFIAHLTNDNFVKELESKDRNFLQKVVDFIADILGISNANELAKKHLRDIISDGTFLEKEGITVKSSDYAANTKGAKELTPREKLLEKLNEGNRDKAEAYHKAKADGSNPELVKAVESLLGKPNKGAKDIVEGKGADKKTETNEKETIPEGDKEGGGGQVPPGEGGDDVGGREGGKKKSLPNRLIEAANLPDDIKEGIGREGLTYNPRSHRQAQALADAILENEGIEKAVLQAQAGKFGGDVNTLVQTSALDKLAELSAKETNPEKQLEYAKQFVDIETGLDNWLRNQAGRGISALAHFYKKTPLGVVMKENKVRGEQFETWAKPKDKSWHEFFDELMKEPDFEKEVTTKVKEELKKERQESRKARIKKVDEWFDKAKKDIEGKNGVVYSTVIPPKIISAALEGMKQAYHAGEKVVEIVQNAIDEISAALGNAKWDKEKFRKEWEDKLKDSVERKPLTDEEIKTRILDKFRKKLKGLSDKERDEVIRRSFKKIIDSGGLDYEDFRKIIGEVTGHGELTPEQANKIKELVKITNSVDDAAKKAREERTPEALKKFRDTENEAGKAAKELQDIFQSKPDILKRLTSIMQLNTLGVASLVNNPVYNIMNQSGVRFPIGVINSLIDIAKSPTEREYNIIASQKEFWNKLGLGTSESIKQLFTGLSRMDYIQKEIHGQRIRPFKAWRDLFTKKKMSGVEITDKILQGTVGIPAEAVARVLNIGDKPQRFAAEGAQASAFAKALGLKDMDYKLFIEFPREEAYRVYKAQGLSDAEASNKADYVKEAIVKEGERSTFQQDNLLNDFLTRAFGVFGGKDSGASQLLKTITVSPYIKIPSNAFWSMYNLLNPEVALAQSFIYGARSRYFKGKGEYVKQKMQGREARYWFAHAITGMAARAVVLSLVGGGVFTPSSDDKDSKKERDATSFYDKTGAFHINGMDVSGKWFGQWGMLFNAIAKKEKDMTPDQRAKQSEWWRTMFGGMEIDGLKEAENSLFGNASTLLQAVNGGDFDRYLTNQIGMFANIIQPASVAQLNRANEDYVPSSRGDDLISKIDQQFAQRSPLYRAITGTHVEKKLDIWGQPIPKGGNVLSRMFGISKSETKQFGRPIYEDAVRTGDSGFLPPAVLPTLNGKKLKESEYRDLQNRIGSERKSLVAPYVNDMSIVSGFNVKYSELSDADKKFVLNYLYDKGREDGLKKFYQDFPELEPKEKQRDYQQEAKEKVFKVLEKYKNR